MPSATGMMPTYVPSSTISVSSRPPAVGVWTATGISCSMTAPVDVSIDTV